MPTPGEKISFCPDLTLQVLVKNIIKTTVRSSVSIRVRKSAVVQTLHSAFLSFSTVVSPSALDLKFVISAVSSYRLSDIFCAQILDASPPIPNVTIARSSCLS